MNLTCWVMLAALLAIVPTAAAPTGGNLIRNGGFEGGGRYWLRVPGLLVTDLMGNPQTLEPRGGATAVTFHRGGKPLYLMSEQNLTGAQLADALRAAP